MLQCTSDGDTLAVRHFLCSTCAMAMQVVVSLYQVVVGVLMVVAGAGTGWHRLVAGLDRLGKCSLDCWVHQRLSLGQPAILTDSSCPPKH